MLREMVRGLWIQAAKDGTIKALEPADTSSGQRQAFHRGPIKEYFDDRVVCDEQAGSIPRPLMILAFSNRSGSNMLAEYLRQTNLVAGLGEYLNHETVIKKSGQEGINSFPDYIRHLATRLSREGQYFGVKASDEQLGTLSDWGILRMFTKVAVIHIHRDDVFGQAISHWIARQTGQWTSLQERKSESPSFDGSRIMNIVDDITRANSAIQIHCARERIPYMSVSYEELMFDPKAAIFRISNLAGIDAASWTPKAPKISRQSSDENEAMRLKLFDYIDALK